MEEDAAAALDVFADVADGGDVGGERAGTDRGEEAEEEGCERGQLGGLEPGLQDVNGQRAMGGFSVWSSSLLS